MATIVAVHSFRGGTGKSNITANLAVTVALQDRRVGIVDTDIQSPGIHVLFGFDEERIERSLNDYLWGQCAIDDAAYDVSADLKDANGAPALAAGAVYLVPSSIRAGEIARILREGYDVELLSDGFQRLIEQLDLDYLFIDTHPGLNEETLLSMTLARQLVLILRPDRQDYQGTAVTVEVARKLDVPRMSLVVNKALPSFDFGALREQVERAYQAPVAGVLPLDGEVARLASGDIFSLRSPDHPWSREVRAIAAHLMADDV
jgi:MinD-like ATPase involved in chromosome partitioning or flagellar assembly